MVCLFQWQLSDSDCSQGKTGPLLLQDNGAHLEAPELWLWGQDSGPPQDLNRTQDSSSMYSQSPAAQDLAWQRKETNNVTRHRRPRLPYLVTLWIHVHGLFPLAVFLNNEDWHSSFHSMQAWCLTGLMLLSFFCICSLKLYSKSFTIN